MTVNARAVAAEAVAAALLLALVMAIFAAAYGLSGVGSGEAPAAPAIVLATVVVALVVRPAHHRLRKVFRRRLLVPLSPVEVLRRLSMGVSGSPVDAPDGPGDDRLPRYMLTVLHRALQTARSELWLVVDGQPRTAARLPDTGDPPRPLDLADPAVHPIRLGGAAVGYLRLETATGREFSTTETRLLTAYADQAGLVLAMIARQLSLRSRESELTERAAALRLSRVQLLDAARHERRRLERDLHDGAQQQLIALGLSVQLARQLAGRAPDRAREVLRQAAEHARRAGSELGRLTESGFRAVAPDETLAAALRHATSSVGVRVTVDADPPDVDRPMAGGSREAVFFTVLEAVQNAIKHATAQQISIVLRQVDDVLVVRVVDRGSGFDPDRTRPGEGIRNIRRRLAELDGTLDVASTPGIGTTVTVTVPFGAGPWTRP